MDFLKEKKSVFHSDVKALENEIKDIISKSKFLVLGGAGTIGAAVVRELFTRDPQKLHVVDLSENNLAELVRDLRSSSGYIHGDFKTYAIDIGSAEYNAFTDADGDYDYVLNLSALKHVRSEKDPYTLMRMIRVNVLHTEDTYTKAAQQRRAKKYFAVSTDKAANPVNLMGASKRIMEMFLFNSQNNLKVSTARFANVAFSDGSLLNSFKNRFEKGQPLAAPDDVYRYFVTSEESAQLCLFSLLYGNNREIFFPKLNKNEHLYNFSEIAIRFLTEKNYEPVICSSEEEARGKAAELIPQNKWPLLLTKSDTTGEKEVEEFFTCNEETEMNRFSKIGVVKKKDEKINPGLFRSKIESLINAGQWSKRDIVNIIEEALPGFDHLEYNKYLDEKM